MLATTYDGAKAEEHLPDHVCALRPLVPYCLYGINAKKERELCGDHWCLNRKAVGINWQELFYIPPFPFYRCQLSCRHDLHFLGGISQEAVMPYCAQGCFSDDQSFIIVQRDQRFFREDCEVMEVLARSSYPPPLVSKPRQVCAKLARSSSKAFCHGRTALGTAASRMQRVRNILCQPRYGLTY